MTSPSSVDLIQGQLCSLDRRLRWKRWLIGVRRLLWLAAGLFLLWFLADMLLGMRTLGLRAALASTVSLVSALAIFDCIFVWRRRYDPVGLAHLLERTNSDLAEHLITLVQIDDDTQLAALLRAETSQQLNRVSLEAACPIRDEGKRWAFALLAVGAVLLTLSAVPGFGGFTHRFFHSWNTPLVPFTLEVRFGSGYALRGQTIPIEAVPHRIDLQAQMPRECNLVCEYPGGLVAKIPMVWCDDRFRAAIEGLSQSVRCHVESTDCSSESFAIEVIETPAFLENPILHVVPPKYVQAKSLSHPFGHSHDLVEVLQYSEIGFALQMDRKPVRARLTILRASKTNESALETEVDVLWADGNASFVIKTVAKKSGTFQANLVLDLEHGLRAILPIGRFKVDADAAPRFTRPLRLQAGSGALDPGQEYRIAADDRLRLDTSVADVEGLGVVDLEYRVNEGASQTTIWLHGSNRREFAINDWLPLPKSLKNGDRLQFRIRAFDNRRMQKGEAESNGNDAIPATDLLPQVATAPSGDTWITLRVDRSIEAFVKQQTQAQANDVAAMLAEFKEKLQEEQAQLRDLQRAIHKQTALQPTQAKQAEKLQKLNQQIKSDLEEAGSKLLSNPALAPLALHFFDIAEVEMQNSADALARFLDKARPLSDAEKELPNAQDAVASAVKKLERMLDWNKMIAQDRLDQWQIENLEKRQRELAQRLENLEKQPLSKEELAEQIEAIRQEQAKLAAETAQLQEKSRLVQDSLAAAEQMRMQRLAKEAEKLADDLRNGDDGSKELLKEKLDKLGRELHALSKKGMTGEAKSMAKESAQMLDEAKKAMELSQAAKAKGNADEAKKMDGEAERKMELAAKQLAKLVQDKAMNNKTMDGNEKTAEALKQSSEQMRKAEAELPKMAKDARAAMEMAAKKLAEASQQAAKQSERNLPNPPARNPAAKAPLPGLGRPDVIVKELPRDEAIAKAWGQLPGELKTRMLQDFRTRFGDDYAELIRQYFERLAEMPQPMRKE